MLWQAAISLLYDNLCRRVPENQSNEVSRLPVLPSSPEHVHRCFGLQVIEYQVVFCIVSVCMLYTTSVMLLRTTIWRLSGSLVDTWYCPLRLAPGSAFRIYHGVVCAFLSRLYFLCLLSTISLIEHLVVLAELFIEYCRWRSILEAFVVVLFGVSGPVVWRIPCKELASYQVEVRCYFQGWFKHLTDCLAVVAPEVRDGIVIGCDLFISHISSMLRRDFLFQFARWPGTVHITVYDSLSKSAGYTPERPSSEDWLG